MTGTEAVLSLPSSVRVGPFDWTIQPMSSHEVMGKMRWGECSSAEQVIRLQREMPTPFKAVDTFLHEVVHALYWAYGVDDSDKEERIAGAFGTGLTQVFRDNPWLPRWIEAALA